MSGRLTARAVSPRGGTARRLRGLLPRRRTARTGAPPGEKITWGKLAVDTPRFIIESDVTIVFPLVAAYLLDM